MTTLEERCRDDATYWFVRLEEAVENGDEALRQHALRQLKRLGFDVTPTKGVTR